MFGLIKMDCIATVKIDIIKSDCDYPIKMGTLIEIVHYYQGGCLFKITDIRHRPKIYYTTIYECKKDDFIPLTEELYLYLLPLENEGRINFMEKVNSRHFDMNMLITGYTIRIRSPRDAKVKYLEFVVTSKGPVKIGAGNYIDLRLKTDLPLSSEFICLSQEYNIGGTGIVVTVDWLLQILYKEKECQIPRKIKNNVSSSFDLSTKEICSDLNIPNPQIDKSKNIKVMEVMSRPFHQQSIIKPTTHAGDIELVNNVNKSAENEKTKCDLLKVEIKDFNRIKEYKTNKHNAKASLNGSSMNILNVNKSGDLHTLKENSNKDTNRINPKIVEHTVICAKCNKTNISICESITLPDCKHKICNDCIAPMTKSRTSELKNLHCPICPKQQPYEDEVSEISGCEMLKLILNSRDNESNIENLFEFCFCRPTASNCSIVLKCKHKFCRAFLMDIFKGQLQYIYRAFCPICCEEIDDCQKMCLIDQMKLGLVKKCGTCSNRADMLLAKCQHPFCQKCIRDLITNQVLETGKVTINCTTCHVSIADSDITQYGSEKILVQLKSKLETLPVSSKSVDHVTLDTCQCVSCKQWISIENGVTLDDCHHYFCFMCFTESISGESNSKIPTCPICPKLEDFEAMSMLRKSDDISNGIPILIECLLCEKEFQEEFLQKCLKCSNSICLNCTKSTVLDKPNNLSPKCPFCLECLDLPINLLENNTSQLKSIAIAGTLNLSHNQQTILKDCEETDICVVCFEKCKQKIVLTNCDHVFCRQYLQMNVKAQLRQSNDTPRCPKCRKAIYQTVMQ